MRSRYMSFTFEVSSRKMIGLCVNDKYIQKIILTAFLFILLTCLIQYYRLPCSILPFRLLWFEAYVMQYSFTTKNQKSADWKAARTYSERGLIYEGKVEGFNGGGLLIRFYSLVGFLPFRLMSPYHSCKGTKFSLSSLFCALNHHFENVLSCSRES